MYHSQRQSLLPKPDGNGDWDGLQFAPSMSVYTCLNRAPVVRAVRLLVEVCCAAAGRNAVRAAEGRVRHAEQSRGLRRGRTVAARPRGAARQPRRAPAALCSGLGHAGALPCPADLPTAPLVKGADAIAFVANAIGHHSMPSAVHANGSDCNSL